MSTEAGALGAPSSAVVSLVLPAWNEEDGLRVAIGEALDALGALVDRGEAGGFEIIVIDDGSTDETAAVAEEIADEHAPVRVIRHAVNRGVGAGLRTGLDAATGTHVVSTDSDMPVDLAAIGPALRRIDQEGADVVAGRRIERRDDGTLRWLATGGYDLLVRLAFGVRVDDVNFAFKVARLDLLRSLDLRSEGPFIDAELIILAVLGGRRVEVVPMVYRPRRFGESSTLSVRTLGRLVRELVANVGRLRRLRWLRSSQRGAGGVVQRNG
ncbi:MAG TPA: glycosyltransferase family 2 protein [Microthrixaceae bacterium]|nr:glycosyltransferase family 2 protein [Acidimicrobiales bacterium]HRW39943.1 glycosyltransferase family 2 protein [Microthrixaceae bacterium]